MVADEVPVAVLAVEPVADQLDLFAAVAGLAAAVVADQVQDAIDRVALPAVHGSDQHADLVLMQRGYFSLRGFPAAPFVKLRVVADTRRAHSAIHTPAHSSSSNRNTHTSNRNRCRTDTESMDSTTSGSTPNSKAKPIRCNPGRTCR